jgi:hypothetical protein
LSDEAITVAKLEEIADRALAFQRFVYRRAWGTYYAVWSGAFLVFVFGWQLPFASVFPPSLLWVPYAVLYGGVSLGGGLASAEIFAKARRDISLRRATRDREPRRIRRQDAPIWLLWLGFYVVAFASFALFQREALSILYAMLFLVEVFLYYTLKYSFPDGIPFEGRLALASFGLCTSASLVATILTQDSPFLPVLWVLNTALWLFCAFYALRQAPDELVELRY